MPDFSNLWQTSRRVLNITDPDSREQCLRAFVAAINEEPEWADDADVVEILAIAETELTRLTYLRLAA